jgi:hypothetical protein
VLLLSGAGEAGKKRGLHVWVDPGMHAQRVRAASQTKASLFRRVCLRACWRRRSSCGTSPRCRQRSRTRWLSSAKSEARGVCVCVCVCVCVFVCMYVFVFVCVCVCVCVCVMHSVSLLSDVLQADDDGAPCGLCLCLSGHGAGQSFRAQG